MNVLNAIFANTSSLLVSKQWHLWSAKVRIGESESSGKSGTAYTAHAAKKKVLLNNSAFTIYKNAVSLPIKKPSREI